MTVRLSGRAPAQEMNGLQPNEEGLVREPSVRRIVVGVVHVAKRTDHGDGVFEPTVEFVQIEQLEGPLRERGVKLLQRAYQQRTGARQLWDPDDDGDGGAPDSPPALRIAEPDPMRFRWNEREDGWTLELLDDAGTMLASTTGLAARAGLVDQQELSTAALSEYCVEAGDETLALVARQMVNDVHWANAPAAAGAEIDAMGDSTDVGATPDDHDDPGSGDTDAGALPAEKETQDA